MVLYRAGGVWVAQALNMDVSTFADTQEEALSAIQEALQLYCEDAQDGDLTEVSDVKVETVSIAVS